MDVGPQVQRGDAEIHLVNVGECSVETYVECSTTETVKDTGNGCVPQLIVPDDSTNRDVTEPCRMSA